MSDPQVSRLLELAGALTAVEIPTLQDWAEMEQRIGRQLPSEYKELLVSFGSGVFGEDLYLFNPRAKAYLNSSIEQLEQFHKRMAFLQDRMRIHFYPEPQGLVVVGGTTCQIELFLKPLAREATKWSLVVCDFDLEISHEYVVSVPEFICKLYRGEAPDDLTQRLHKLAWPSADVPLFTPRLSAPLT